MTGPLNDKAGRRVFPGESQETGEPITLEDMGEIPEDYTTKVEDIEREAETSLRSYLGADYTEGKDAWDPFTIPLKSLPPDTKNEYVTRLDELTGLTGSIGRGQYPAMFREPTWTDDKGIVHYERSPAGRMVHDPSSFNLEGTSIDPRVLRQTQQTVRQDHARSILTTEQYYSAGTHLRERVMRRLQKQVDDKLSTDVIEDGKKRKGKVFIFDVETPGLDPSEGMWQISGQMIHEDGTMSDQTTRYFDNARMRLGGEVGPDRQNLLDYSIEKSGGEKTPFEQGMKEFFREANQADYVGGHNVLFDYRALHYGVTHTPGYANKTDKELVDLADTFFSKFFYDSKTKKYGNFMDTNQLARVYLHQLPLDEALKNSQSPYQFSMQNIMLQTDLLARIKEEKGEKYVADLLEQGTHFAHVDVPIEAYAFKYMQEGAQGGRGLAKTATSNSEVERKQILQSTALTPTLPLTHPSQLHKKTRLLAEKHNMIEDGNTHISPLQNMVIASRDLTMRPSDTHDLGDLDQLTFLQRHRLQNRTSSEAINIASNAGIHNRIFGKNVTEGGRLRNAAETPTQKEWERTQREFRDKGIPLPGLSWPDRHLTALMGKAGPDDEQGLRSVFGADVNPMGEFFGAKEVKVVGSDTTRITTMPIHILEKWEADRAERGAPKISSFSNPEEELQILTADFFPVKGGQSEMGLTTRVEQNEAIDLLEFLEKNKHLISNELENDPSLLLNVGRSLNMNSGKYGLQVGTLTGFQGGMGVEELRAGTEQLLGFGAPGSDQTSVLGFGYAGREGDRGRTLAAIIDPHLMEPEERAAVTAEIGPANKRRTTLKSIADDSFVNLLKSKGDSLKDEGPARAIVKGFNRVRKNYPILGIAAATGGVGYYEYQRKKKNKELSESMSLQSTTSNPRPTYDVMQKLDRNKTNHTNMSSDKNKHLYGAGY